MPSAHNDRDPMLPQGSDKCRCTDCGLYFNSTHGFEKHRVGKVGTADRRCLTIGELQARGWSQNRTRHWITTPYGAAGAAISRRLV